MWRDLPDAVEHLPTGLTFPDTVANLARQPLAPGLAPEAEQTVEYLSEAGLQLRITLAPAPAEARADVSSMLAERLEDGTAPAGSRTSAFQGSFPVLCAGAEERSFAYRTFSRPRRVRAGHEGYSLRVGGSALQEFDWWYAAIFSGHLVVIESEINRDADLYYGADLVLRDLTRMLGWPCRLPKSEAELAAEQAAREEEARRTPPERTSSQAIGMLWARAVPHGGFGADSSLGPRPVERPPAPGSYAAIRPTGLPHLCAATVPSFFGGREEYEVYVEGDDFATRGRHLHFVRIDGVGYSWSNEPVDESSPLVLIGKFRLDAYAEGYRRIMHQPPPRWEDLFAFVEPADSDPCAPTAPREIALPDRELRDVTDAAVARWRDYFESSVESLAALPFEPLLPHPSILELFPGARGSGGTEGYGVQYLAHGAGPEGESSNLSIGFGLHTDEKPASQCGASRVPRSCEHFATTNRGVEIFRDLHFAGSSSSNPRLPRYHAKVGGALVHLDYIYWSRGPRGAAGWRAHEFAEDELEAIFDSLQTVDAAAVVRFPGMSVSR